MSITLSGAIKRERRITSYRIHDVFAALLHARTFPNVAADLYNSVSKIVDLAKDQSSSFSQALEYLPGAEAVAEDVLEEHHLIVSDIGVRIYESLVAVAGGIAARAMSEQEILKEEFSELVRSVIFIGRFMHEEGGTLLPIYKDVWRLVGELLLYGMDITNFIGERLSETAKATAHTFFFPLFHEILRKIDAATGAASDLTVNFKIAATRLVSVSSRILFVLFGSVRDIKKYPQGEDIVTSLGAIQGKLLQIEDIRQSTAPETGAAAPAAPEIVAAYGILESIQEEIEQQQELDTAGNLLQDAPPPPEGSNLLQDVPPPPESLGGSKKKPTKKKKATKKKPTKKKKATKKKKKGGG